MIDILRKILAIIWQLLTDPIPDPTPPQPKQKKRSIYAVAMDVIAMFGLKLVAW